jgi:hypothetical protein
VVHVGAFDGFRKCEGETAEESYVGTYLHLLPVVLQFLTPSGIPDAFRGTPLPVSPR